MNPAVENYIFDQPSDRVQIIQKLRWIILSSSPKIQERFSYKIPFYYYLGPLCYIFPRKKWVDLSFINGTELSNSQGLLEKRDRKTVCSITYQTLDDIQDDILMEVLHEAILLKELKYEIKRKK